MDTRKDLKISTWGVDEACEGLGVVEVIEGVLVGGVVMLFILPMEEFVTVCPSAGSEIAVRGGGPSDPYAP
jgi:hypothetical protein